MYRNTVLHLTYLDTDNNPQTAGISQCFVPLILIMYDGPVYLFRSHGSEGDVGDAARIPRTNSTADLVAHSGGQCGDKALPAHPEGPNIGPASEHSWFRKER